MKKRSRLADHKVHNDKTRRQVKRRERYLNYRAKRKLNQQPKQNDIQRDWQQRNSPRQNHQNRDPEPHESSTDRNRQPVENQNEPPKIIVVQVIFLNEIFLKLNEIKPFRILNIFSLFFHCRYHRWHIQWTMVRRNIYLLMVLSNHRCDRCHRFIRPICQCKWNQWGCLQGEYHECGCHQWKCKCPRGNYHLMGEFDRLSFGDRSIDATMLDTMELLDDDSNLTLLFLLLRINPEGVLIYNLLRNGAK